MRNFNLSLLRLGIQSKRQGRKIYYKSLESIIKSFHYNGATDRQTNNVYWGFSLPTSNVIWDYKWNN